MRLLVSACLLGVGCRYDGQSNQLPQLEQLLKQHTCIPVCAELFGGLPTPRVPAERQGNRVVTRDGDDVTEAFVRGTAEVLRLADLYHCRAALLKERTGQKNFRRHRQRSFRHLRRRYRRRHCCWQPTARCKQCHQLLWIQWSYPNQ